MIELFSERYGGVCEVTGGPTQWQRSRNVLPRQESSSFSRKQKVSQIMVNSRDSPFFYRPMPPFCDCRNYRALNTPAICCAFLSFKCTDQTTHNRNDRGTYMWWQQFCQKIYTERHMEGQPHRITCVKGCTQRIGPLRCFPGGRVHSAWAFIKVPCIMPYPLQWAGPQ